MGEIEEIFRQFQHGTGEWKQFLNSIKITNIHGWVDQEIHFRYPVVAIVGENGIGKSTFLKAAVCAYDNKGTKDFYPSQMFVSTQWDNIALEGATIEYNVRLGDTTEELRWRKTKDWGYKPKKNKPIRNVFFLDISRTLPLDATAGYAKIAKATNMETVHEVKLNEDNLNNLSYILGQKYIDARFVGTNVNTSREVGLLTKGDGEISQFHQGAGEDTILDMMKLFQDIPNQSLLVIDEVENSLHPQAQRRLIRFLLQLARIKKIQIILSTHSPYVLEELPEIARIMLVRLADRKDIIYNVSSQFALSTMDEVVHPELYVFLEDEEAVALFWEILKQSSEQYEELSKKIIAKPVGTYSVVNTLNDLAQKHKLPYNSLAIIDGDKKQVCPSCFALPGNEAPEIQVFKDLKEKSWNHLDNRFGIGAGALFKYLDDAMLLKDHHEWTTYVGNNVKMSKDIVWQILIDEWVKQCLGVEVANRFVQKITNTLSD